MKDIERGYYILAIISFIIFILCMICLDYPPEYYGVGKIPMKEVQNIALISVVVIIVKIMSLIFGFCFMVQGLHEGSKKGDN